MESKTLAKLIIIGGLFYLGGQYIASQPQRTEQEVQANREITVSGSGEVVARPDVARISLSVQTGPQATAASALEILATRFGSIVKAVENTGVEENDIKTTDLSVHPRYDYSDGRQELRGFEASETVEVTIRDLDSIVRVLAVATGEGVNQAGGLQLSVDDPDELQLEAQEQAIADARQKAEQLADALGVRLGRVKSFSSSGGDYRAQPYALETAALGEADLVAPPVPIGEQNITSNVSVTFEIR